MIAPTARRGRRRLFLGLLLLAVAGSACGHSGPTAKGTRAVATTPATTAPTTVSTSPLAVHLSDGDNGRIIAVGRGGTVTVVLHSTYWTADAPGDPAVLREEGPPTVAPHLQGCVPGEGCGTVTARYLAVGSGRSHIAAHRRTCGEALGCAPGQGAWQVTISVT